MKTIQQKKTKVGKSNMEVSKINIYPINGAKTIKANGNISFNNEIVISFTIMNGKNGIFVKFPSHSYEDKDGITLYKDDVYFIDTDFRDYVIDEIMKMYSDTLEDVPRHTNRRSR